jgi:hypothetical protein
LPKAAIVEKWSRQVKLIDINRKIKNFVPFGYYLFPTLAFYKSFFYKIKFLWKK